MTPDPRPPRAEPIGPAGPTDGAPGEAADGTAPAASASLPRPSLRAAIGWLVITGIAIALDGLVGGLAMVAVAAIVLAGLSPKVLGALGTLLLLGVPVAIFIRGVPSAADVSPAFVTRSLVPHHLTFAGLILVSAGALLDLWPHLVDYAAADRHVQRDGPPLGAVLGAAVVLVVAIGAVLACMAVLQA